MAVAIRSPTETCEGAPFAALLHPKHAWPRTLGVRHGTARAGTNYLVLDPLGHVPQHSIEPTHVRHILSHQILFYAAVVGVPRDRVEIPVAVPASARPLCLRGQAVLRTNEIRRAL